VLPPTPLNAKRLADTVPRCMQALPRATGAGLRATDATATVSQSAAAAAVRHPNPLCGRSVVLLLLLLQELRRMLGLALRKPAAILVQELLC
jgi:hypothetical protein